MNIMKRMNNRQEFMSVGSTSAFGAASMMGGALSTGAGKLGMGSAMSGVSEMMPVVGSTMMLGHTVRMTSKLMPKKGKKGLW